jgi:hypothetical protein
MSRAEMSGGVPAQISRICALWLHEIARFVSCRDVRAATSAARAAWILQGFTSGKPAHAIIFPSPVCMKILKLWGKYKLARLPQTGIRQPPPVWVPTPFRAFLGPMFTFRCLASESPKGQRG